MTFAFGVGIFLIGTTCGAIVMAFFAGADREVDRLTSEVDPLDGDSEDWRHG